MCDELSLTGPAGTPGWARRDAGTWSLGAQTQRGPVLSTGWFLLVGHLVGGAWPESALVCLVRTPNCSDTHSQFWGMVSDRGPSMPFETGLAVWPEGPATPETGGVGGANWPLVPFPESNARSLCAEFSYHRSSLACGVTQPQTLVCGPRWAVCGPMEDHPFHLPTALAFSKGFHL